MINTLKFFNINSTKIKFCVKKLLCNTEYKQKVSDFLLPYFSSGLKKNVRDL
jgi:hypothetical protein